jgi:hypothetical protein
MGLCAALKRFRRRPSVRARQNKPGSARTSLTLETRMRESLQLASLRAFIMLLTNKHYLDRPGGL